MRSVITAILSGVFCLALVFSFGCSGHSHNHSHDHSHGDATEQTEKGKEYTSKYICPMHCEGSGSEEAGKCPVCGMDYVLNEEFKEE